MLQATGRGVIGSSKRCYRQQSDVLQAVVGGVTGSGKRCYRQR